MSTQPRRSSRKRKSPAPPASEMPEVYSWQDGTSYSQNRPRVQTTWGYRSHKIGSEMVWICNAHIHYPSQWVMGSR